MQHSTFNIEYQNDQEQSAQSSHRRRHKPSTITRLAVVLTYEMWLANNTSADQSAHPRSLISAFIIHILLSTIVNEYRFSICPFVDVRSYFLIKVITCWLANNKSADHSAHPRSLISAFIIRR